MDVHGWIGVFKYRILCFDYILKKIFQKLPGDFLSETSTFSQQLQLRVRHCHGNLAHIDQIQIAGGHAQ